MKILLSAAATAVALAALAGCSGDDDAPTAEDPASKTPTTSDSSDPSGDSYPDFEATDYSYVLEQVCYCPITGPVKVTVEDGEVTSAVTLKRSPGLEKGSEAPEFLRLTINDIIAKANDDKAAKVDVEWPDDQDWPSKVAIDQIELATDDEVTYLLRGVSEG